MFPAIGFDDPEISLLVLLIAGHLLGDFLFQTRTMVARKGEQRVLWRHAAVVFALHVLMVVPLLEWQPGSLLAALSLLILLGLAHFLIDLAKTRWAQEHGRDSLGLLITDQALHCLSILVIWSVWIGYGVGIAPWFDLGLLGFVKLAHVAAGALIVSAYVLNGNAAAVLIKLFLARFSLGVQTANDPAELDVQRMGWTIGILERMLLLSFVILGQWEAVGWLFAGKTVARFRELDDRSFSEYYLIGTLSSLLFATASGSMVRLALLGSL